MNTTFKVRFWEIADWTKSKDKKKKKGRPYGVRWVTEHKPHSEWYSTKALAHSRRAELMQAARDGEPFNVESGLPVAELKRRNSLSFVELAQSYMDMKWPDAAAKTRTSTVDALATAGTAFVRDAGGRPEATDLRRVLTSTLLPPTTRDDELSPEDREVVDWIVRHSRPMYDLTDVVAMRDMLDALATKLDGKSAAATVYRRKRAVLFNMLSYAVERELLPDNPMTKVKRTAPKIVEEVDPRVVANPAQVRRLLTAVTYVGQRNQDRGAHLTAFFAVGYYAAARPAEGLALREQDCTLPTKGWGELALGESRPTAGKRWTDSGEVHDRRGLNTEASRTCALCRFRRCWWTSCGITWTPTARGRMVGCSAHRTPPPTHNPATLIPLDTLIRAGLGDRDKAARRKLYTVCLLLSASICRRRPARLPVFVKPLETESPRPGGYKHAELSPAPDQTVSGVVRIVSRLSAAPVIDAAPNSGSTCTSAAPKFDKFDNA